MPGRTSNYTPAEGDERQVAERQETPGEYTEEELITKESLIEKVLMIFAAEGVECGEEDLKFTLGPNSRGPGYNAYIGLAEDNTMNFIGRGRYESDALEALDDVLNQRLDEARRRLE